MFMLGVGIDWAEEFHDVALGRPGDGVFDEVHVDHTPAALDALIARIVALEPDPAEVRVVIETRHGLLVERLVDAGFTVLPVNPDLIARRRGPAKKKDDAEDARIACLLALDRFTDLRALVPHGAPAGELRAIARDDVRAQRDALRLLNRLRADLLATFPAAMIIAAGKVASRSARSRLSSRRASRWARTSSRAIARSSPAGAPWGTRARRSVNRSSASRHAMRASSASSFFFAGPRRRAIRSGLTGSTVNPASTSRSTSSPWRVSMTTRTSAGSGSSATMRAISASSAAGVWSTWTSSNTPSPGLPSATSWNSSAQSIPTPSMNIHLLTVCHRWCGRRRGAVLMDQSSRDNTLVGVRPSEPSCGDAVSRQSSRDKRPKRSPQETPMSAKGSPISARLAVGTAIPHIPHVAHGWRRSGAPARARRELSC